MKPKLNVNEPLPELIDKTQDMLGITGLYQRSGTIVRVVRIKEDNLASKNKPNEYRHQLKIKDLKLPSLKAELMRCIDFVKYKKVNGEYVETQTQPPYDLLAAILEESTYPALPLIKGISECPFMRKSGTICDKPGFDFESGYFYNPSVDFGKIPKDPTLDEARKALEELVDIYCDFPFVTDYYRHVPVAAILSILARPMFVNTPIFVIESSTAGTGKSLISDTVSLITTGRIAPKQTWPEGREGGQELEKFLSAIALDGSQVLMFDNVPRFGQICGAPLDKVSTSNGYVKFRILGKSEAPELPWNTVITFTGNNIVDSVKGDTRRRVIPARMEPDTEHPELRSGFKYEHLLEHVKLNRVEYVRAVLTVLRYHIASCEYKGDLLGSFEDWTKVVVGAIKSCDGPDIMDAAKYMQQNEDEDYSAIVGLFEMLGEKFVTGATTADIIRRVGDGDFALKNAIDAVIFGKRDVTPRVLGKFFAAQSGRIYNGNKLVKAGVRKRSVIWNVVKSGEP